MQNKISYKSGPKSSCLANGLNPLSPSVFSKIILPKFKPK